MEILRIEGLCKQFHIHWPPRDIASCQNISFTLSQGQFIGIVGRSGAGKSTILKCIHRSYLPTAGRILYRSEALGEIDLVVISTQVDRQSMAKAWFYLPRMLHRRSKVILEQLGKNHAPPKMTTTT